MFLHLYLRLAKPEVKHVFQTFQSYMDALILYATEKTKKQTLVGFYDLNFHQIWKGFCFVVVLNIC